MGTKLVAARLATSAGVTTVITRSSTPDNISKIVKYTQALRISPSPQLRPTHVVPNGTPEDSLASSIATLSQSTELPERPPLHTRFLPSQQPIRDRYFWLLHGLAAHGTIYIDAGASRALADKAGLLPVGVLDVEGTFASHEAVRLVVVDRRLEPGPNGRLWEGTPTEIGKALVNYSNVEILRIKGHRSIQIEGLLGYSDSDYVADRANISLLHRESRPVTPVPDMIEKGGIAGYEASPRA
jgi:glutamate 5-kinase